MPKTARELSAKHIQHLTKPGHHPVGGVPGLLLHVAATGRKYWVLRYATGEKRVSASGKPFAVRRDYGIGPYPEIALAQAREKARGLRDQIRDGVDPVQARRERIGREAGLLFRDAAEKFLATKTTEFRNPKHAAQWGSSLATYAFPVLGDLPVQRIELAHVIEALTRDDLWTTKPETASRVRGRIESVLAWATVSGFRTGDNPARWKGHLDAVLPKPNKLKRVQHFKALPIDAAPGFLADLRQREGTGARALEFALLTAARSGEVRGATWDEIDIEGRTWTIPGDRMKAGREHVVPLSDDAIALLKALPRLIDSPYVFPSARGGMVSDMSLSAVMKRMSVDAVPHGLRSTFRDWISERTGYPHEVAEAALAHTIPNAVERAYRRGDLLAKRTRLMDDWARFLNDLSKDDVAQPRLIASA